MPHETWREIFFPEQTAQRRVTTGVCQRFYHSGWEHSGLLIYFQIFVCPYLCRVLKISSTVNILNFNYLLNILKDKLEGKPPPSRPHPHWAEVQSSYMSAMYQKKWVMSSEKDCLILQFLLHKLSDLTFCAKNLLMNQERRGTYPTSLKQNLQPQKFCCFSAAARATSCCWDEDSCS